MKRVVQLILILVLILISSCKETYPSFEECAVYSNQKECESHEGCIYTSSISTVITQDYMCYYDKDIFCVPGKKRDDSESTYGPLCRVNEDGTISRIEFGNYHDYKLGDEWSSSNCPFFSYFITKCYSDIEN